jgi:sterol 14-demethylase
MLNLKLWFSRFAIIFEAFLFFTSPNSCAIFCFGCSFQLKFIRQGLQSDKMKAYSGKIVMEVENYFSKWGQTGQVDLHEVLSEVTILTASRCLLGDEIRERLHTEFAELYKHLNDGMTPITVFFPYAPIKAHKDRDSARAQIVKLFSEVIQARRVIQQDPAAVRPIDFLQMLIDAEYRDGGRLNDDEICGLLLAALFAGQHTSSITSTWMGLCLINLGAKLMGDLRSEQKDVLGRSAGGQVTVEALEEMQLMHAVMKETLRLYSPLIMLMRKVKQPLEYTRESDGQTFVVPEGDIIISSPPVSHRLPEVFSDPETFDPYRFESGFSKRNEGAGKYQFSPFGGGRHTCLGERFAFLQIKTIWSVLVRNFNFELVDGVPPIDFTAIVAGPKGACRVKYTRLPKPIC